MAYKTHIIILAYGCRGIKRNIKYGAVVGTGLYINIHVINGPGKAESAAAKGGAIIQVVILKLSIQRHQFTGLYFKV